MAISVFIDLVGPLGEAVKEKPKIRQEDYERGYEKIVEDFHKEMKKVYKNVGTPGYKWPANNPSYIKYDKRKRGKPPGVRTGLVMRDYTAGPRPAKGNKIELGTKILYANFSAVGANRPRVNVRVDPFIEVFRKKRGEAGGVRDRRVPVRDPLLQVFSPKIRKLRRRIANKWQGFMADAVADRLSDQLGFRVKRARRRRNLRNV